MEGGITMTSNEINKAKYRRCKETGICVVCRKHPAAEGTVRCKSCLEKRRELLAHDRKHGICTNCHTGRTDGVHAYCNYCRAKARARSNERKERKNK